MRTPISDVICSTKARSGAALQPQANAMHTSHNTHGVCSRAMSSPSVAAHTKTNRDHPPTPPTQTQTETPQTRAVAAPDTLVHSNPIGRRTPTTWSAHPRSPTISHDIDGSRARSLLGLERADNLLWSLWCLTHSAQRRGGRLGGRRHRCKHFCRRRCRRRCSRCGGGARGGNRRRTRPSLGRCWCRRRPGRCVGH